MDIRERGGYIKLYRSLTKWEWYKDPVTFRLWVHLLLKANWETGRFMGEVIFPGSLVTSYRHLAEETGLSIRNVRTALKRLKLTQEVTLKTTSRYTIITIEKWAVFQGDEESCDTASDTVSGNQVTHERHASDTQVTTIEEIKNIRNIEVKNNLNKEIKNNHGAGGAPPLPPQDIAERISARLKVMNQELEERNARYDSEVQA